MVEIKIKIKNKKGKEKRIGRGAKSRVPIISRAEVRTDNPTHTHPSNQKGCRVLSH